MGAVAANPALAANVARLRRTARIRLKRQASDLAHDFSHADRVARTARLVAENAARDEGWSVDADVLECAALLHEIGRGAERRGESTLDATLRVAEEMLRADGLGELVWPVCEAILAHKDTGRQPETPEARALSDADALEELGAIGISRAFAAAIAQAVPLLYDLDDPLARDRPLDDGACLLDRLPKRQLPVAEHMESRWAADEAARRAQRIADFYAAFFDEAGLVR
ncbi:MAG: HD domain-containing protein [Myxococcales bacterium]|nr:HD domain-containing protein [Myxococcales bacterium]MCB9534519.1 HD domain-containing protein [Myxococcales bacterium]